MHGRMICFLFEFKFWVLGFGFEEGLIKGLIDEGWFVE